MGSKEWFDLDLWTCNLKINRDHIIIKGNFCTKFGIDQVKGSKDIDRTTQWSDKSGLTLTFEHVTWKSTGIIYSLRAIPVPSLVLIQWSGQRMLSGQHLVYRPTDRPIDRHTERPTVAKQYAPFFKGGIKRGCCILNLEAPDSIAYFYISLLSYYKTNKMRVWQKFSKAVNNLNAEPLTDPSAPIYGISD